MSRTIVINTEKKFPIEKRFVKKIFLELSEVLKFEFCRIEVSFVSDKTIQIINKEYLNHDWATDIITFNYAESDVLDCELIISYETAFDNANKFNVDYNSEIVRLLIHGILHVVGYDDKKQSDRKRMKRKENFLVKLFADKYWIFRR